MVDVMTTTGNTIDRVAADPANTKFVLLAAFFGGIMSMSFVDGWLDRDPLDLRLDRLRRRGLGGHRVLLLLLEGWRESHPLLT